MSAPKKLAEIQRTLQQSLLNPYGSTFPEGLIKSSKRLGARDHFAIYQRSYTARLRECMAKQFSALEYALGEDLFRAFADEYLREYPSTSYNLFELGKNFASYLENSRPDKDEEIKEDWPDFMIELAKFEYYANIIFEEKVTLKYRLATEDTLEKYLRLIPIFHLFKFQFPIQQYYSSFANEEKPGLPMPGRTFCAITRHDFKLSIHNLNEGQFELLSYMKTEDTIESAKEIFISETGVSEGHLEQLWPVWKKAWLKAGFFRLEN